MGVHGLWRLIEPSGKPVPLETLENKILAVDVSIWLHQAVKGFQDSKGAPVPNAHLLGIYHRVCKLLYFKIKPVFIFDGGVPVLKKETIAKRNQQKSRNISDAEKLQKQLISTLLKHSAVSKVLSEKTKASLTLPSRKLNKHDTMYALPSPELDSTISSSEEEVESTTETSDSSPTKQWDVYTIDMTSTHFKSLPVDVRHEILTELKETRKQNSWGRLHQLPKQSDDFSTYQVKRLMKRQAVQSALEDAEKEMGGHSLSLAELESILKDHGVATTNDIGKRIASDENTRYLYIKDLKQALEKARKEQLKLDSIQEEIEENLTETDTKKQTKADLEEEIKENNIEHDTKTKTKADLEFEEDLEKAIALSLQEEPSTSKTNVSSSSDSKNKLKFSFIENFNDADFDSDASEEVEEVPVKKKFSSAQSYMMEYSGLTPNEINKILGEKNSSTLKSIKGKKIMDRKLRNETVNVPNDNKSNSMELKNAEKKDGNSGDLIENAANKQSKDQENELVTDILTKKSNEPEQQKIIDAVTTSSSTSTSITRVAAESSKVEETEISSDSSSGDEFEEVPEEIISEEKSSMEIIIDINEKLEDDLFGDIFNKTNVIKIHENIVIQSQTKSHESISINIFEEKKEDEHEVTVVSNEESLNNTNIEIMKNVEKISVTDESEVSSTSQDITKRDLDLKNNGYNKTENRKDASETVCIEQKNVNPEIPIEQMRKLRDDLQKEKIDILVEKSTKERMAGNITDQMYQEAQELLELFGVPYIVAPMEAEAQCAFLDAIELTDGTITDDSDIWLFGGHTVYKNFFNQSKYVMEFKSDNIKHHFKLTREQMILLALLVGSDYTVGLQGVGPVTALEILAAFPPMEAKEFSLSHPELLSGLKEFRSWFTKGKSSGLGRTALKNKLKNVAFTDNFPSLQVVQAYLEPTVETSKEKFTWSKPDFVGLTDFAKEKFGWSSKKTEEILKPVIKKVEENQTQRSIKSYFKTVFKADSSETQNQMSKRVQSAINRIGKTPEEIIAEEMEALSKEKQKRTRSKTTKAKQDDSGQTENKPKRSRKKKLEETPSTRNSDASDKVEAPKEEKRRRKSKKTIPADSITVTDNVVPVSTEIKQDNEDSNDLKKYEDIAADLKKRRQKRAALIKKVDTDVTKRNKLPTKKVTSTETIPEGLEEDDEIQLLRITTSKSLKRTEEIDEQVKKALEQEVKKPYLPNVHNKEVIHQKLRDKSNLLRNKMKAIEVFRKSKKGPGYVPKREKKKVMLKDEAELSENSSDD